MLEELKTGSTVVGLKQLRKVLKDGTVQKVFLARNAEPRLVEPIEEKRPVHLGGHHGPVGYRLRYRRGRRGRGTAVSRQIFGPNGIF